MNPQEVAGDWLTPSEAAKELRVSMGTIYSLLSSGRVPSAIRVGNQWRLSRRALATGLAVMRSHASAGRDIVFPEDHG
jgi:excisionase family DNA binding protein